MGVGGGEVRTGEPVVRGAAIRCEGRETSSWRVKPVIGGSNPRFPNYDSRFVSTMYMLVLFTEVVNVQASFPQT